jgi:hypothetical protein
MALSLAHVSSENIKVIVQRDSSLAFPEDDYQAYLDGGLDESKLRFKEGDAPTRFVLRTVLPYALAKSVKNAQTTLSGGEVKLQFAFTDEDVRCSLVDIENPAHVPQDQWLKFEKAGDGGASEKLMSVLMASGISMELFTAKQAYLNKGAGLKKS